VSNLWEVVAHIGDINERHADRDGLTGLERAVFLARGGHAPGQACPTAEPTERHEAHCAAMFDDDAECNCAWKPYNPADRGDANGDPR
jgi:hypothetical protein